MNRLVAFIVFAALVATLSAGCAPSQGDIEKVIREEMKSRLDVEVASIDLTRQADGGYAGTATATNGDVYEVTTNPPKGNRIEWKALPSQSMIERDVKAGIEAKQQSRVTSLILTKQGPGVYTGTAELEDGTKMNVTTKMDGKQLRWEVAREIPGL